MSHVQTGKKFEIIHFGHISMQLKVYFLSQCNSRLARYLCFQDLYFGDFSVRNSDRVGLRQL